MEIIPISQTLINGSEEQTVDARALHVALEVKKPFTQWIEPKLKDAMIEENIDYMEVFNQQVKNPLGGRPSKEYVLTLDLAKHIAMMSHTEKAKEVRTYFIEVEKRYRSQQQNGISDAHLIISAIVPSMEVIAQGVAALAESQKTIIELLQRERPQKVINNTLNLSRSLTKESEEVFIEAVLNVLKAHPRGINQTLLLRHLGRMKADKTSTKILHDNVGLYWNATRGDFNSIIYTFL